ncbi:MAG: Mov34/MPN/PAD-1 family protein, partial [Acidobacteria bacterium]|nr:Mov34/MPN/PAD-1 family protein [Acidobacteriota bacterium]
MIVISEGAVATIDGALRTSGGLERCGFLLGRRWSTDLHIERFVALPHAGRAGSFSITDVDVDLARRLAAISDVEPLAILHTHPSGTLTASESDKEGIRRSRITWVIAVRFEGTAAGFRAVAYEPRSLNMVPVCIKASA